MCSPVMQAQPASVRAVWDVVLPKCRWEMQVLLNVTCLLQVGNNFPVFFVRDGIKFPGKRQPKEEKGRCISSL